jgi:hypothetical protein
MLSNTAVKNAKAGTKPYKLSDGRRLFLRVQPTGAKWWRYMFAGREKLLSLGTYPDTSLALARESGTKPGSSLRAETTRPPFVKQRRRHRTTRFKQLLRNGGPNVERRNRHAFATTGFLATSIRRSGPRQ